MELIISQLPAASTPHERYASTKGELAPTEMKLCNMSGANFDVGGWGSPVVGCFPPCGVSPRGVWGLCPLRFLCRA